MNTTGAQILKEFDSYIWESECPNYQITPFVFFYFQVGWGWFVGDSTWLIYYKKQTATQLYCQIPITCINSLYSNNMIAHSLRKIHISGNRENTVQRLIYQGVIEYYMQQWNYIKIRQTKTKKLRWFMFMFCSDMSVTNSRSL
jgi:hypothetical protein